MVKIVILGPDHGRTDGRFSHESRLIPGQEIDRSHTRHSLVHSLWMRARLSSIMLNADVQSCRSELGGKREAQSTPGLLYVPTSVTKHVPVFIETRKTIASV
jgi:hypothetical protein